MAEFKSKHTIAIEKMDNINPLLQIINKSRLDYVKDNLSQHLHTSQIESLKEISKTNKPHHRAIKIKKMELLAKKGITDHMKMHQDLFLKKYKKLEKRGLVCIKEETDNALPYEVCLTEKGEEMLKEINDLELAWSKEVIADDKCEETLAIFKDIALKSMEISTDIRTKKNKKLFS